MLKDPDFDFVDLLLVLLVFLKQLIVPGNVDEVLVSNVEHCVSKEATQNEVGNHHEQEADAEHDDEEDERFLERDVHGLADELHLNTLQ